MKLVSFTSLVALSLSGSAFAQVSPVMLQVRTFEQPYWTKQPVIEALGRAKLQVPPNRARFSVEFRETNTKAGDAMQAAVERARIAYDAIKAAARDAARVKTSISIEPYYKQYRDRSGERIEDERADKVEGYAAEISLNVTMLDVNKAGEARAAALALEPEYSSELDVFLERTAEINRTAYEAAVNDAALRAKASARATGAKLGRLMVLQEGNGPCLGKWSSPPGRILSFNDVADALAETPSFGKGMSEKEKIIVTGSRLKNGKEITITQADIDALNLPSDYTPQTVTARVCAVYAIAPK